MPPEEAGLPPGVRNLYERTVDDSDVEVYVTDDEPDRPGAGPKLTERFLDGLRDAPPGSTVTLDETKQLGGRSSRSPLDPAHPNRAENQTDRDSAALAEEEARKRSAGPRSSPTSDARDGGLSSSLGAASTGGTLGSPLGKSTDERLDELEDDVERIEAKLDALLQLHDADVSHE